MCKLAMFTKATLYDYNVSVMLTASCAAPKWPQMKNTGLKFQCIWQHVFTGHSKLDNAGLKVLQNNSCCRHLSGY